MRRYTPHPDSSTRSRCSLAQNDNGGGFRTEFRITSPPRESILEQPFRLHMVVEF